MKKDGERKGYGGTKDYIGTFMRSREEALVHCIAHEFRHAWQFFAEVMWDEMSDKEKEGLKEFPGDGSDYDADKYAIKKMKEWRRLYNSRPVYQDLMINHYIK
jgi:hypothetical protein